MKITLEQFQELLPSICAQDTAAADGKGWTPENPTFGHCAVASLIVQDLFGGELMRVSLEDTEFSESKSHYFNCLPGGTLLDITLAQFQGQLPRNLPAKERTREYVLGGADTKERYERLKARLNGVLLRNAWEKI